jgi:transcriptional/translational regulatory protein YebC/TACO1|tara:strand:- start:563 stop:799 length:237 start_codon:yes stop_codon:yes gene_type:complete
MAGHSKWKKVKHKKGKADDRKGKLFSKLSKNISIAAKMGGVDPNMNFRLKSAVQAAKDANMPKDKIQRAIDNSKNLGN